MSINILERILYKYCSDPVKFLVAQINSVEESISVSYHNKILELLTTFDAFGKDSIFTPIEKYVVRKSLNRAAKVIFTKKVYGFRSQDYTHATTTNDYMSKTTQGG